MEFIKDIAKSATTDSLVAVGLVAVLTLAVCLGQERLCDTLAAGLVGFLGRSVLNEKIRRDE